MPVHGGISPLHRTVPGYVRQCRLQSRRCSLLYLRFGGDDNTVPVVREQRGFPGQCDGCGAMLLFFLEILDEFVDVDCAVFVHFEVLLLHDWSIIKVEGKKCVRYIAHITLRKLRR